VTVGRAVGTLVRAVGTADRVDGGTDDGGRGQVRVARDVLGGTGRAVGLAVTDGGADVPLSASARCSPSEPQAAIEARPTAASSDPQERRAGRGDRCS
jgi:hypothetical protein